MDIQNEVNNTVKDIKENINGIENAYQVVDSNKAKDVKDKAIRILAQAIVKLEGVYSTVTDPNEAQEILKLVKEKSSALTKTTLEKIYSFKDSEEVKEKLQFAKEKVNEAVETIKENEKVKATIDKTSETYEKFIDGAKDNIDNILAKPEVNEKIEKAKDVTIDVCEKAVKNLKAWLRPEEEVSDEENNNI